MHFFCFMTDLMKVIWIYVKGEQDLHAVALDKVWYTVLICYGECSIFHLLILSSSLNPKGAYHEGTYSNSLFP